MAADDRPFTDESAQRIYDALAFGGAWRGLALARQQHRDWFHALVSSTLLAAGTEPVSYVTFGTSGQLGDQREYKGLVFTDTRVIELRATDLRDGRVEWSVSARSLKGLTRLDARATGSPYPDDYGVLPWPGTPSATLCFRDGAVLAIPLDRVENPAQRLPLVETVKRLSGFLT